MADATITIRVDEAERQDLAAYAAREKLNLSDYIRVRLGLRVQETQQDADVQAEATQERAVQEQLADHELRLQALERAR